MAKLALRVPWGVVVAVLAISCTPATDEPSPTATPTTTAAATATPTVTPTPVPPPVTSDTWPELSLDATISPSCRAQIIDYAEFSGTLAEIAQQEAALSALFGYQFSRLTDRQLRDIDSRLERLGYEFEYQGVWNYGVYAGVYATPTPRPTPTQRPTPTPRPTPTQLPRGLTPTPTATPVADARRRVQLRTGPRGSESVQSSTPSEPHGPVPPRRARRLLALCGLSR